MGFSSLLFICLLISAALFSNVLGFTGTYGVNYGRISDNLPPPGSVPTLLKAAKIKNVRIYDADHDVLTAFEGSDIEITLGLGNEFLKDMSHSEDRAMSCSRSVPSELSDELINQTQTGSLTFAPHKIQGCITNLEPEL